MATRVVLNDRAFLELNLPEGLVGRAVAKGAGKMRDDAKRLAPVDTGALRQSIRSYPLSVSSGHSTYRVEATTRYAYWQHEGVRGPIYPRRAKVLRFKPKGAAGFIFRPSVSGFPGTFYLTKAAALLRIRDFT
jgi:hypothetical protein